MYLNAKGADLKRGGGRKNIPYQSTRKEGNVLFNDALNTFYLRLYGVGHMVKYHSDTMELHLAPCIYKV